MTSSRRRRTLNGWQRPLIGKVPGKRCGRRKNGSTAMSQNRFEHWPAS